MRTKKAGGDPIIKVFRAAAGYSLPQGPDKHRQVTIGLCPVAGESGGDPVGADERAAAQALRDKEGHQNYERLTMTQIENLPIDSLKGAPYNPRKMPDAQMAKLMKGLAEYGMVEPIIVNDRSGLIVGGHQRWEAAKRLGWDKVPVVHIDLDDAKEKALNLALNKISGEFDFPKLAELLQELDTGEIDLDLTGFTGDELEAMMTWTPEETPDFQPVGIDEQGKLDQKKPVTCPECGHEFTT